MNSSSENVYKKRNLVIFIIISIILILIGGYSYWNYLSLPADSNNYEDIIISIPKGASTSKIASILREQGLIKSELYFKIISKKRNVEGAFKAGNYKLNKAMYPNEIIDKLVNGEVYIETIRFTVPEGFELRQIVDRIVNHNGISIDKDKLIYLLENGDFNHEFLKDIPKGENRLEGFLFPDTYEVKKDITEKEIIILMLNRFNQIFKKEYYDRAKELGMSIKDIVTLASIIEREAKIDSERKIISSVFHNRLKKKMLLQSCATIQYALGERKEKLTYKDLEIDSPYNTYKYVGLPPMPICSPGKDSIEAALFPAVTDYLYFVAKGDGSHIFSKTYSEHLKAQKDN